MISDLDQVVGYISRKGWDAKPHGSGIVDAQGEIQVRICPFCGNQNFNFSLNTTLDGAPYKCWTCQASGNLRSLMRHQGDDDMLPDVEENAPWRHKDRNLVAPVARRSREYRTAKLDWAMKAHAKFMENEGLAKEAMEERGITAETAKAFTIGVSYVVCGKRHTEPYWVFPYIEGESVRLIKYRSVPPAAKSMAREAEMESVLYNWGKVDLKASTIVVCEGEIDAMSVWQAGHRNVVSVSVGAGTFRAEWVIMLERFSKVVLLFDSDDAGRRGRDEIIKRLGEERVHLVDLPEGLDANDVLVQSGPELLSDLIAKARPVPLRDVVHVTTGIEQLQEELLSNGELDQGLPWMFEKMDRVVGKVRPAQLWVVCGSRGSGKSTLMRQQLAAWAMDGVPVLYWCGEMSIKQTTKTIVQCQFGLTEEQITTESLAAAYDQMAIMDMYLGMQNIDPSRSVILEMCTQAYKRYGVKVFVIDNLGLITQNAKDPILEEGRVTQALNNWAIYYDTTVFLITHPRKRSDDRAITAVDGIDDVKGSGNITNFAAQAFTLFRKKTNPRSEEELYSNTEQEVMDRRTAVIPMKARYGGGSGTVWLWMEGEMSRFRMTNSDDFEDR